MKKWRILREYVLWRDQRTCAYCGAWANHVDHIMPRARGGSDAIANLVAACARCNLRKHAKVTPETCDFAAARFDSWLIQREIEQEIREFDLA